MRHVLVLGANGQIARLAEKQMLADSDVHLTLFLRRSSRLKPEDLSREKVVDGDAADRNALTEAMNGTDIVYANLAGQNIEDQAKAVVASMKKAGVNRLIWISTLGIYDEVPGNFGKWNNQQLDGYLDRYGAAAKVVENAGLDETIIRPAWLTNKDEIDYETTQKNETFKGTEVSRKSVAAYVTSLVKDPAKDVHKSVGINKPNTDGDKPAWY
ncbi:SDR family oxidoreductase [Sporolactobacillus vineae]|uniref:SDR family oxidoreductase n=1 Tax=Sporolactobacillus vineae TaxID=444463 RepID=UPI000288D1A8|nr:SDR family oxidoreductase [Sporolactobacillus vineae]